MDGYLKASTSTYVLVGPYLSTDGLTGKANLKISVGSFQIGKNGAAFANKTHTAIAASSGLGWYRVPLSITDVNTPGNLQYKSSISAAVKVYGAYTVLPKPIYSAWFATGYLPVNAVQIEGVDATNQLSTAVGRADIAAKVKSLGVNFASSTGLVKKANPNVVSAGVIATGAFTNVKFATGALSGGTLAATAKSSIGTAVWLSPTRTITGAVMLGTNAVSAGAVAANAIGSAAIAGATVTKLAVGMFATTGSLYSTAKSTSVVKQTADNAGGSALTADGIATVVWSTALSGHSVAGTAGGYVVDLSERIPAALTADGNIKADALKVNGVTPTTTASFGVQVAKALFTTATTMSYGDAVAGSPVKEIADNAVGSALTESGIAAAVKSLGVNYTASTGLVKKASANVLSAAVIATGAFTNAKFATGALSGGTLAANAKGSIGTATWATTTRQLTGTQTFNLTGNVTGNVVGNVTGSVGSVIRLKANTISAPVIATGAITNAKVAAAALSTGHFKSTAIPGQVAPPAAVGLPTQVSYLYKFMRNKVAVDSTAGTVSVYDDSGVTVDHVASITDASGTFTRTEFKAGT